MKEQLFNFFETFICFSEKKIVRKAQYQKVFLIVIMSCVISGFTFGQNKSTSSTQQTKTYGTMIKVSGQVVDENGVPIVGANVFDQNSKRGTMTDISGKFSLVADSKSSIKFSYIGYQPQIKSINGKSLLKITLLEASKSLNDVVVIGYGSVKKQNITTSISKINSDVIDNRPLSNLGEALVGQMAGVSAVATTGIPGSEVDIQIRGVNSIDGNTSPLYVIDGVPNTSMSGVNPNDVESVQVLKDASATAIYGAQGSNGVILIETKKGTKNATVTFNSYYGLQQPERMLPLMDSKQWLAYQAYNQNINYLGRNTGASMDVPNHLRYGAGVFYGLPDQWLDPNFTNTTTDWLSAILQLAPIQSYQMSASVKNDAGSIYLSGGYMGQDGIVKNTYFNRINFRLNASLNINKSIRVGVNLAPTISNQELSAAQGKDQIIQIALGMMPVIGINDNTVETGFAANRWPTTLGFSTSAYAINPVVKLEQTSDLKVTNALLTSFWGEIDLSKKLRFRTQYGYNYTGLKETKFVAANVSNRSNPQSSGSANDVTGYNWTWQNTLTYDNNFSGIHQLNILLGQSMQYSDSYYLTASGANWPLDDLTTLNLSDVSTRTVTSTEAAYATASFFARANYTLKDRYILSATVRTDGSSRFGTNHKWGTFPAFSAAWKINEEPFMKDIKWITLAKVRGSWGHAGNDRSLGVGEYMSTLTTSPTSFANIVVNGLVPTHIPNPDLQWESTISRDIGGDFSFLNNRFMLTVDYYNNVTNNLLYNLSIPSANGFTSMRTNLGSIGNYGWEFELTSRNIFTKKFKWTTTMNLSANSNKVLSLGGGITEIRSSVVTDSYDGALFLTKVGQPVGQFLAWQTNGILTADCYEKNPDGTPNSARPLVPTYGTQTVGNYRLVDQPHYDKDGNLLYDQKITNDDMVTMGTALPDLTYGITNNFSWGPFDMSVLIQGQLGGKIEYLGGRSFDLGSRGVNQFARWDNCYKPDFNIYYPGKGNPVPSWMGVDMTWDGRTPGPAISGVNLNIDQRIFDATYLRIKNAAFSYTMPSKIIKMLKLGSVKFYVSIDNLYTFTSYIGTSPEANTQGGGILTRGVDYASYPTVKRYTLGLDVRF